MAKTFTIKSNDYQGRYLELVCTQTQDIANNKSTISWVLSSKGGTSSYYSTGATTAKIGSKTVYDKERVDWDDKVFPAAKGSTDGSFTVEHNSDGTLSLTVSLSTAIWTATVTTTSDTWTLDNNPRGASITAAPNFNDEQNPTISYSNPAGNNATSLQACIASADGLTVYVPYRDITKTGTSYTFNLTDTERTTLRNATPNSKTLKVRFYIQTVVSGNTFRHRVEKTLTITNANPTLNPSVYDPQENTAALTGDANNKFIKYYSNAQCTSGAAAVKGASITSVKIECGSKSRTSNGLIADVESGSFKFTVTDSRGNTATQTVTKTLINYVMLTCNLDMDNPTADGTADLNINGSGFTGSFGVTNNTVTVKYRYKVDGGSWGSYITVTPTFSGSRYTARATVTGLDYTKRYVFQATAVDKLATVNSQERKVKTLPVFDWGENDFNFNVPVKLNNKHTLRISEPGNTVLASEGENGLYLRPNGSYNETGEAVLYKDGKLKIGGYNLTGAAKAMSTQYTLDTTYEKASNYTVNSVSDAVLIGNNLRCHFDVTRSAAVTGNVTNERILTLTINHGGKIKAVYSDLITTSNTGAVTCFYISNSNRTDTTISFQINLAATTNEGINFDSFFTLPVLLDLDKY